MAILLIRFAKGESGATAIEYGLVVSLIFLAVTGGMNATGVSLADLYRSALQLIATALNS